MRRITRNALLRTCLLALTVATVATMTDSARAEPLIALNSVNTLFRFDSSNPAGATPLAITGLGTGVAMRSIDYRPSDGRLYGLATNNSLYTVDLNTGAATLVAVTLPALSGNVFSLDFNPIPDSNPALPPSLRIVSDTGNNYRAQATPGGQAAVTDTSLTYAAGDPQAGRTPTISGIGYANNVFGATSTTLFYIDTSSGTLATATAANGGPNGGVLSTLGGLGIAPGFALFDMDISGLTGVGYMVATNQFGGNLYTLNLSTTSGINNRATLVGQIDGITGAIIGIAAVPEPASLVMLGLGLAGVAVGVRRARRA